MRRLSLAFCLALFVSLGGLTPPARLYAQKEFGFDNRKASGQPYWKAEETVAKFKVAAEFEVKLFAAEPQVTNPVAFTIDEKGRVWVVECFEYPKRTPKGKAPRDRIVILEDTDGDGVCDKRTVFAEGKDFPVPEERAKAGLGAFDLCTGIEVGHGGVFVGAAPYLFFIENKNDKPGKFEVLLKGFGSQDTHETLNTFQWGPDGWLYGLHGVFTQSSIQANPDRKGGGDRDGQLDGPVTRMNAAVWRYHPKQKKFEIFAEGTSNPWGMDWRNTDGQFVLACCVIPHLYHMVPGGIYKRQAAASYNPYVYGYLNEICDHTFHKESGWAHAGLLSLDVPHMPKKYQNSVIFGSIHGCSIKQNIRKPNGSTFTASRGDDFLVSGDKNFRPINLRWGPAGDIYLIDWHDQHPCHQTNPDDWDYDHGRVYRIQLKGTKTKKPEDLGKKTDKELAVMWKDTNPYRFRTAMRLLSERYRSGDFDGEVGAVTRTQVQENHENPRALWPRTAAVHDFVVTSRTVEDYIQEKSPVLRAWAIRMFGERFYEKDVTEAIVMAAKYAATESDPSVRRELASAAIRLSEKHDVTPILRALMARKEDAKDPVIPQLVWLAYEKVISKKEGANTPAEKELAWLAEEAPKNEFVRDSIVPKVMRRLVATGQASDLKLCVEFVAKLKDAAAREKALEGLVTALDKQTVNAPEGWSALQAEIAKDKNPKLVALANKLAVSFRDPAAIARAIKVLRDSTEPDEARMEAVRQLALVKAPDGDKLFLTVLRQGFPLSVKLEAARGLAAFDDPKLPASVFKEWAKYPPALQAELVGVLAGRKEWARELLKAIEAKTVDRRDLTDNTVL